VGLRVVGEVLVKVAQTANGLRPVKAGQGSGPNVLRQVEGTERPVHVGFTDDDGNEVAGSSVALVPTAASPNRK
jgi:hypothetical protein